VAVFDTALLIAAKPRQTGGDRKAKAPKRPHTMSKRRAGGSWDEHDFMRFLLR
jgi:hypothetical protein